MQCSTKIIIRPFIGLHLLQKSIFEKQSLLIEVSLACSSIVIYINETKTPWALNRRIKQVDNRSFVKSHRSNYEHANIVSFNDTSLTRVAALSGFTFNISEICSNRPVSNSKIIQLGHLLEYTSITSLEDVFDSLNCSDCK